MSTNNCKSIFIFLGSLTGGGAERVASTLSKDLLKNRSYRVTLVTLGSKRRDFYKLEEGVNRIAMNLEGETKGLSKIFSNVKRVAEFRRLLKKEKPVLVIAFMTRYAVITLLASVFINIKVIVSERNYPPKRENHGMWEFLRKYVYKYANLHVVQTDLIAQWIKQKTKSKSVQIIPNSINWPLPNFDPVLLPENYLDKDSKVILAAGTFKHQKGFDLLLKAISGVLKEKKEWKLVILGDEKGESDKVTWALKQQVAQYDMSDQILLPGRAGNIAAWYKRSDIFVLSSRYEGFPNVLLEAMASGCACISFDCKTGPSEMITHLEDGILVPEGDVATLSNEIKNLVENTKLRKKIAQNAVQVRDRLSGKKIMKLWADAVKTVLN